MAKKRIGIMATAAAAMMVIMLIDIASAELVCRTVNAIVPAPAKRPIATASLMMKPITLLRRRRCSSDCFGWDNGFDSIP